MPLLEAQCDHTEEPPTWRGARTAVGRVSGGQNEAATARTLRRRRCGAEHMHKGHTHTTMWQRITALRTTTLETRALASSGPALQRIRTRSREGERARSPNVRVPTHSRARSWAKVGSRIRPRLKARLCRISRGDESHRCLGRPSSSGVEARFSDQNWPPTLAQTAAFSASQSCRGGICAPWPILRSTRVGKGLGVNFAGHPARVEEHTGPALPSRL